MAVHRWSAIRRVIKRADESFDFYIFRPTTSVTKSGVSKETFNFVTSGRCTWIYPEEYLTTEIGGRTLEVDVIFLMEPTDIKRNDVLVRRDRENEMYRILGDSNFLSHLEVKANRIDQALSFPQIVTKFTGNCVVV